jgi:hypothetical protein
VPNYRERLRQAQYRRLATRAGILERTFQQSPECKIMRQLIVSDCWQLKMEIDSYNENYNKAKPIQSVFDFIDDLAELEIQAKEHPRQAA